MTTKNKKGICKYCGQEKELCSAHIIPKSFYCLKQLKPDDYYIGIDRQKDIDKIHYQNGIKDDAILCSECDRRLGEYDKYAKEILFDVLPKHKLPYTQIFLLCPDNYKFDYQKLRYFFISLVWRASISNSGDSNISLGKYEDIALKILKGEIPDNTDLFCPFVFKRTENYKYKNITEITHGKYDQQYKSVFDFPGYHLAIITNTEHIKKGDVFINKIYSNKEEFFVIETDGDLDQLESHVKYFVK